MNKVRLEAKLIEKREERLLIMSTFGHTLFINETIMCAFRRKRKDESTYRPKDRTGFIYSVRSDDDGSKNELRKKGGNDSTHKGHT